MEKLYDFNHQPENWTLPPQWEPGTRQLPITISTPESSLRPQPCGGPLHRRALQAVYTIAFLCLLRIDKVLKIRVEHIEWYNDKMVLSLPFRKTHQFGGE